MFGFWQRKYPEIYKHWYVPLKDFTSNSDEFYLAIEEVIRSREVPDVEITRVPFAEGGWLSANRTYLRIRREKLVFDICSAKFGTGWYFSCRGATIPSSVGIIGIIFAFIVLSSVGAAFNLMFGPFWGAIIGSASLVAIFILFFTAGRWQNVDDALLQLPVVGNIYEALFRRETYYRQDARNMYLDVVDDIIREQVRVFVNAGGVEHFIFKEAQEPQQVRGMRHMIGGAIGQAMEKFMEQWDEFIHK